MYQFRQAIAEFYEPASSIIFIEKRKSFPTSLENAMAFSDLSVRLTMLFSRR